jgi:hypothetical protein
MTIYALNRTIDRGICIAASGEQEWQLDIVTVQFMSEALWRQVTYTVLLPDVKVVGPGSSLHHRPARRRAKSMG